MGVYSVSLPAALWLQNAEYSLRIAGHDIRVRHHVVEQEHLDPRLGGFSGSFGFERDPPGLLRYSVLRFSLDDNTERRLLQACFGDRFSTWALPSRQRRVKLAAAVCGVFLDRYRALQRDDTIEPFNPDSLAHLQYADDGVLEDVRLYGGRIAWTSLCIATVRAIRKARSPTHTNARWSRGCRCTMAR